MPEVPSLDASALRARAAADAAEIASALDEPAAADPASAIEAPQIVQADTAFVVAWIDGQVIITTDLNTPIVVRRYPTADDITGAGAVMVSDRTAETAARLAAEATVAQAADAVVERLEEKQREAMSAFVKAQSEAQTQALGQQLLGAERRR